MVDLQNTLRESDIATLVALASNDAVVTLKSKVISISAAALKAAAAAPPELVAAVADVMLVYEGMGIKFQAGTETLAEPSAPDELEVKYTDGAGVPVSDTIDATNMIIGTADLYGRSTALANIGGVLADRVNTPLVLHNTGGEYTGNASNDAVLICTIYYREVAV